MRALAALAAVICVATVATQALALGMLWWHGRVTADTVTAVREALETDAGPEPAAFAGEDAGAVGDTAAPGPTHAEVLRARALAVLNLRARSEQLDGAAAVLLARADAILADRERLAAERAAFREELDELRAEIDAEAVERSRGVLLGLGPNSSVGYLMTLPVGRALTVLRGMPERAVAKILEAFAKGTDEEGQRGRELFAALSAGEPERAAVEQAAAASGAARR